MEIRNSADYYDDSGIKPLLMEMELKAYFEGKSYGNNAIKLFIVIVCVPHDFKIRKRFDSKDKVLYWDIILDYVRIKESTPQEKKNILANSMIDSFDVLDKYKKLNLNKEEIQEDAKKYFIELKWL